MIIKKLSILASITMACCYTSVASSASKTIMLWPNKGDVTGTVKDIQRAMGIVRKNAKEWNVDPERCGVMGFSAGGHLAARVSNNYEKRAYTKIDEADSFSCKPNFSILIYPAYLATRAGKVAKELPVTKATPPTFIVHAENDKSFLEGVRLYTDLLKKKGVPVELNLFKKGGHAFAFRNKKDPISKWPQLCESWLNKLFNK